MKKNKQPQTPKAEKNPKQLPKQNPDEAGFIDNVSETAVNFAKTGKKLVKATRYDKTQQETAKRIDKNIHEVLNPEYQVMSVYLVGMLFLVVMILWTAVATVEQVQSYHNEYSQLQALKREFRQLQIERQKMLIEQQTFSATPQVTNRAVAELNMFYPNISDRLIINNAGQLISTRTVPKEEVSLAIDPRTQH